MTAGCVALSFGCASSAMVARAILDGTHRPNDPRLRERMQGLVDAGRRGDAVKLFMRTVGAPAFMIAMMRVMPVWWSNLATLKYCVIKFQVGKNLP